MPVCYTMLMYSILVIAHVTFMIVSLALMVGAIGLGFFGKQVAVKTATVGMVTTVVGVASGFLLLLDSPLSLQCATLSAYLLLSIALYKYGFGLGDAQKARFIKASASIQKNNARI